jgi:transglutaminase-like putative cysteine protease
MGMAHFRNRQGARGEETRRRVEEAGMILRLWQKLWTADALGMQFVALALWAFVYGIASSLRNTETESFFGVCLAAAGIGFGLAKARWNGIRASAWMAALGVLLVWVWGARLPQPLFDLCKAALAALWAWLRAIGANAAVDLDALRAAWRVVLESSSALATRLQTWRLGLDRNVIVNDALVRSMAWTLLLWLCAAWMGWFTERRKAVTAFLPALSLLAAVISYSEDRSFTLWLMTVLLLLLMGTWNYRDHTLRWLTERMDYSESIGIDTTQAVLVLTLVFGGLAFVAPSVSWRELLEDMRNRRGQNEAAEMLGIQQPPDKPNAAGGTQKPFLPREHLLNSASANSETVVMYIRTGELPPAAEARRYYWRNAVYDKYAGSGWTTSASFDQTFPPDTPLLPGLLSGYRLVQLEVEKTEPDGVLVWSGILFRADIPLTIGWRVRPTSNLFADQEALLLADMYSATAYAAEYEASVYVPAPTFDNLRAAPAHYPEDIRLLYLYLPRSVPQRVFDLAEEITGRLSNPYEKAKAIETHLRAKYPYDLAVPSPPGNRDVADYFLFELQRGYCDYYATAMVVLARASGLPARFVSGYAPGVYDAPHARYVIREKDAHSWAEVYFSEIGWVEFEPTASLPEIERDESRAFASENPANDESAARLLTRFRAERIFAWASPLLGLLTLVVVYYSFVERWLAMRLAPEAAIHLLYQRFYGMARPFAGAWTRAETSSEFLHKFIGRLAAWDRRASTAKLSAQMIANASALTEMYQASLFANRRTGRQDAARAWCVWKRLRVQLLRARLLSIILRNMPGA